MLPSSNVTYGDEAGKYSERVYSERNTQTTIPGNISLNRLPKLILTDIEHQGGD